MSHIADSLALKDKYPSACSFPWLFFIASLLKGQKFLFNGGIDLPV